MAVRGLTLPKPFELLDVETAPSWFHEHQLEAWVCTLEEVVALAGNQGGKTAIQAPWLLREIARCAEAIAKLGYGRFLYVGPTLSLLEQQAIPSFRLLFEETHRLGRFVSGGKPKFTFSAEGKRKLGIDPKYDVTVHFAYANDSSNLESITALAGVWDEAGQKENKLASYHAFNRRLKIGRELGCGRRLWGSTPYEWNWFKDVIDQITTGAIQGRIFTFPTWANPLQSREACEQEKNRMPEWQWNMMYLGQYERPMGSIYDCFDRAKHTCERFEIPDDWIRAIGLDFGNLNTAAVFLAREELADRFGYMVPTGRWYLYRSYHIGRNATAKEHTRALLNRGNEAPEYWPEPRTPECWGGSHQEDGWREAFSLCGLPVGEPIIGAVESGIEAVYAAIKEGKILVFDDEDEVIADIEAYRREVDDTGEVTDVIAEKSRWHRLDGLRYVVPAIVARPLEITDGAYSLEGARE